MAAFKRILAVLLVAAALVGGWMLLRPTPARDLLIEDAWARMGDGGLAVYLAMANTGGPDRLLSATSPVARTARIVSPAAVKTLPIPQGARASLAPDGAHIVLDGLDGLAVEGRLVPLTLAFENAGQVAVQVRIDASEPQGHGGHMAMMHHLSNASDAPWLSMTLTPDSNGWLVRLKTRNFVFAADLADGPHEQGTGHGHLYLDGLKLGRVYAPEIRIGTLPPGNYIVRVTLNTNDHRVYMTDAGPVTAMSELAVR